MTKVSMGWGVKMCSKREISPGVCSRAEESLLQLAARIFTDR